MQFVIIQLTFAVAQKDCVYDLGAVIQEKSA